ncbi:MAG TPA: prolyl oligopeptidase family serine peptidase [Bryobacteraceae bacterium]|nr:prolyl oligopeptidase family serine peptidase [Bryobacteraceae bacterium]
MRCLLLLCSLASAVFGGSFTVDDLLRVANATVADVSADGRWAALIVSSLEDRIGIDNHRYGDPTYIAPHKMDVLVVDTRSGATTELFPSRTQAKGLKFSPDGSRLALLAQRNESFALRIWDRASGNFTTVNAPDGKAIDESGDLAWTRDGAQLILGLRAADWKESARERFLSETMGPVIFHSSTEPFLAWIAVNRLALQRSIGAYDVATGKVTEISSPSLISGIRAAEDGSFLILDQDIAKKTDYDTLGAGEARVEMVAAKAGASPKTLIPSTKGMTLIWSKDLRSYAYAKDDAIYFGVDDKEPRLIAGKKKDDSVKETDSKAKKDSYTPVKLSPKGDHLVASSKDGLWMIDTASSAKELFVKMPEEDKLAPRYQALEWTPSGDAVYLSYSSRTRWERGVSKYDVASKRMEDLIRDARIYSGFHLSHDGSRWVYLAAESNRPPQAYAADASFKNERRLTDLNPQLADKNLAKAELVPYLDADGKKLFGVLYYPSNYEKGKKYPTIFNLYEQFFDDTFNGTISVLTANGYAVMQPSVDLEIGFPGEAWEKGVTSAANKLIEMGVADLDKLGVQGTSYGGYATNLLITQTNRFKAAVNISGKVNMVSFYTDSPRLGVRNIHAPEHSQDRLGATLWQQPQKYLQHSAILFADRIKTPLLLTTGEADWNVPARQAMEMYFALRRLGKEVAWANYLNGGHGMPTSTVEDVKDFHARILKWYDDHLKNEAKKVETDSDEKP